MKEEAEKIREVELKLDRIELEPLPDFGDLIPLGEFVKACKQGRFINYDGTGYYATKDGMSRKDRAVPSTIKSGMVDERFTHVMWFNR